MHKAAWSFVMMAAPASYWRGNDFWI